MRDLLKSCWAGAFEATGGLRRRHAGKLVVLTFHRIRPGGEDVRTRAMRILDVLTSDFRRILQWMCARYEPIVLGDWVAREAPPEKPSFAVTFDDGWLDNYEHAYPVLRELGVPATIFLSTGAVEDRTPFWWQAPGLTDADIEQMKEREAPWMDSLRSGHLNLRKGQGGDYLQWDQVREMARSGLVRFGPHGHGHALMDKLSREEALADVRRCVELMVANVPEALVPALAWPNGNARFDLSLEFKAMGLRAAFGTRPGAMATPADERWNLPRNSVDRNVSRHPGLLPWLLMRAK